MNENNTEQTSGDMIADFLNNSLRVEDNIAAEESDDVQHTLEDHPQDTSNDHVEEENLDESAELNVEDTSDTDDEVVEVEFDVDDPYWFQSEHSVYKSPDEAKRGIEEKDKYILQLKDESQTSISERDTKINELESQLESLNSRVELYNTRLPEDQFKEVMIQEYIADEYKGLTENDFLEDEDLRKYKMAHMDAEIRYERDLKEAELSAEEQQKQRQNARETAQKFVEENLDYDYFNAKNFEDQHRLNQFLNTPKGEYTPKQMAVYITEAFGENAGNLFRQGLKADFMGGFQEKVIERIKHIKTDPGRQATPPPRKEKTPLRGLDAIKFSLEKNSKKRR